MWRSKCYIYHVISDKPRFIPISWGSQIIRSRCVHVAWHLSDRPSHSSHSRALSLWHIHTYISFCCECMYILGTDVRLVAAIPEDLELPSRHTHQRPLPIPMPPSPNSPNNPSSADTSNDENTGGANDFTSVITLINHYLYSFLW